MAITAGTPVVASGSSSLTITLTAGRSVVVGIAWEGPNDNTNASTINAISFTNGNGTATVIGSAAQSLNGRRTKSQLAYLANVASSGSSTISITWTGGTPPAYQLFAVEFAGADTATFYDGVTATGSDTPNTDTVSTGTLNSANDLVFGIFTSAGQSTLPTVSGYTGFTSSSLFAQYIYGFYKLDAGDTTSETLTTGITNASYWTWNVAALKPAGVAFKPRSMLLGVG